MTTGARIRQAGANSVRYGDISRPIADVGSLSLRVRKLALEKLAATTNGAEGVALDNEQRGVRSVNRTATGADLLCQRLVNPGVYRVHRLGVVDHLSPCWKREKQKRAQGNSPESRGQAEPGQGSARRHRDQSGKGAHVNEPEYTIWFT